MQRRREANCLLAPADNSGIYTRKHANIIVPNTGRLRKYTIAVNNRASHCETPRLQVISRSTNRALYCGRKIIFRALRDSNFFDRPRDRGVRHSLPKCRDGLASRYVIRALHPETRANQNANKKNISTAPLYVDEERTR